MDYKYFFDCFVFYNKEGLSLLKIIENLVLFSLLNFMLSSALIIVNNGIFSFGIPIPKSSTLKFINDLSLPNLTTTAFELKGYCIFNNIQENLF